MKTERITDVELRSGRKKQRDRQTKTTRERETDRQTVTEWGRKWRREGNTWTEGKSCTTIRGSNVMHEKTSKIPVQGNSKADKRVAGVVGNSSAPLPASFTPAARPPPGRRWPFWPAWFLPSVQSRSTEPTVTCDTCDLSFSNSIQTGAKEMVVFLAIE